MTVMFCSLQIQHPFLVNLKLRESILNPPLLVLVKGHYLYQYQYLNGPENDVGDVKKSATLHCIAIIKGVSEKLTYLLPDLPLRSYI